MNTATKIRYRSPSIYRDVEVEVSLDDFDDSDIRKEYEHRLGKASPEKEEISHIAIEDEPLAVRGRDLRRIRTLMLCGQTQAAIDAMQDVIRDALGTAL